MLPSGERGTASPQGIGGTSGERKSLIGSFQQNLRQHVQAGYTAHAQFCREKGLGAGEHGSLLWRNTGVRDVLGTQQSV